MNMFRNLLTLALLLFGIGLFFGHPDKWTWINVGGAGAVKFLAVCIQFRPFVVAVCGVTAVALWMTRKQY